MQALNNGVLFVQQPDQKQLLNSANMMIDQSGDLHLLNQSGITTGAGDAIMFDDQ